MQALTNYLASSRKPLFEHENVLHLEFECEGIIGVYQQERIQPQKIMVNITLYAMKKWDLDNHLQIKELVQKTVVSLRPQLLEKMVLDLKKIIIQQWPRITYAHLIIKKPNALCYARCSFVELIVDRRQS